MAREALKLALEALKIWEQMYPKSSASCYRTPAITAIKEALAQPAQEPVAWHWLGSAHFRKKIPKNADITAWNPVYIPPQREWVGLTDDEMWNAYTGGSDIINLDYAKAIEAKLKERNS